MTTKKLHYNLRHLLQLLTSYWELWTSGSHGRMQIDHLLTLYWHGPIPWTSWNLQNPCLLPSFLALLEVGKSGLMGSSSLRLAESINCGVSEVRKRTVQLEPSSFEVRKDWYHSFIISALFSFLCSHQQDQHFSDLIPACPRPCMQTVRFKIMITW